ncbi:S8 family serine peptidase [Actinoplanes sp. NPDC026619]|uniref:S8 family serine peptidase n=1 Tax=Actinoplanes sp. NPDC026619 TaxID=3155798 RepID=UPI0033E3417B
MAKRMWRYGAGVLAAGALAGAGLPAMLGDGGANAAAPRMIPAPVVTDLGAATTRQAVTHAAARSEAARNLMVAPEKLVPKKVTAARPARVVTTVLDSDGRPAISVRTATDRAGAVGLVRRAQRTASALGVELDVPVKASAVPAGTDPLRSYQWDLDTIRAPQAWERSTGAGAIVAVLDSGVNVGHPDLAAQVLPGADMTTGTEGPAHDVFGHGTHVAGTIAAATGNGTGIAGIAPDVKILPVQVLNDNGSGQMSVAAQGVVWATDHGADVINLSISGASSEQSMTAAIAYARSRGTVVVASAGNDRQKGNPASYPAAEPGVIAVAATDQSDNVASFSTAGGYVDIAAPGNAILSTYIQGSGYARMNGTSMAAPHVAAAAALLRSADPALTPDQIEQTLESSAVDLGAAGRDDDYGYGRLDIATALAALPTPAASPAAEPTEPTPAEPTPDAEEENLPLEIDAGLGRRQATFGESTGTSFTVTMVGDPVADRPVNLCVSVDDADFTCSSAVTDAAGTVSWNQLATAPFRVRLSIPGADATATVAYDVRATVSITADGPDAAAVTIGGVDGQTVLLQRFTGTTWATVQRFPAGEQTRITGLTPGARYRVALPMTRRFVGVISPAVQL